MVILNKVSFLILICDILYSNNCILVNVEVSHFAAVCREVVVSTDYDTNPQRINIIERSSTKLLATSGRSDSLSTEGAAAVVASSCSSASSSDHDEQQLSCSSSDKSRPEPWSRSSKAQLSRSIEEISMNDPQEAHDEGEEYHASESSSSNGSIKSNGAKKQRRHINNEEKDTSAMDETA